MRLVEKWEAQLTIERLRHALRVSWESFLANEPVEHHHEVFLLLSVQLAAIGVGGPDHVFPVGHVVVETYVGHG